MGDNGLVEGEETAQQDWNYLLPEMANQEVYILSGVMLNLF